MILDARGNPVRPTIKAQYEAATYSPQRSGIFWPLRDAKDDGDKYTRDEVARLAWHLWQNSPTTRGLVERLNIFTIGTGIHPFAASSDTGFNEERDALWESDSETMELTNDLPFSICQDVASRSAFVGGDSFSAQVDIGAEMPKLDLFESHQIGPHRSAGKDPDGITRDGAGRAVGFTLASTGKVLPVEHTVHHWLPERPGQCRGMSILAPAINTARTLEDILLFEKDAVAENSRVVDVIESATGEPINPQMAYRGATVTLPDGTQRTAYYQKVFGATSKVLNPGDKYVEKRSDRPSAAWQGFVAWLAGTICLSTGFPESLILGSKVGGADTRREAAIAQRIVERWQYWIARQWTKHVNHWCLMRIQDGSLSGAPDDWRRIEWQFPRALTVDAGREAKNDRDDVRAGLLSEQEYHGRYSVNWLKHRKQIKTEARRRIQDARFLAKDENIPFELALSMLGHTDDSPEIEPTAAPAGQPAKVME